VAFCLKIRVYIDLVLRDHVYVFCVRTHGHFQGPIEGDDMAEWWSFVFGFLTWRVHGGCMVPATKYSHATNVWSTCSYATSQAIIET
jgi:hypothetical protein